MGVLKNCGIDRVHHYAPLHYLVFIGRSGALWGKPTLRANKFGPSHLRAMSFKQDIARGFGDYAFLTLDPHPRILKAKLAAGFPHIAISATAEDVEVTDFALCRFNVAMTRQLKRNGKPGFPASSTNGRYYGNHQIPVARTDPDKIALLRTHLAKSMIEVLVNGDVSLSDETEVICYSALDAHIAQDVLRHVNRPWNVVVHRPPGAYPRNSAYVQQISNFIDRALAEPGWRGNGLDFDRLR